MGSNHHHYHHHLRLQAALDHRGGEHSATTESFLFVFEGRNTKLVGNFTNTSEEHLQFLAI